ncbi:MAG: SAM-dependent methyltransferase [Proteobacteria bacterium]|nr:SAM-dependent methyltransferase [Pseudomonadota bacterium]
MLPLLTADENRHAQAARDFICERILAAGGWLSFADFMESALYAPGLGYYSAGAVKLGASGDFVTAPEISDLFSRCVARQCADVLAATGGQILELGAGTGRMAVTILKSLAEIGVLPERYAILEVSADLAERQRARVEALPAGLRERVVWLDRLPAPGSVRGVVLANEVLDALPVQRFVVRSGKAFELGVSVVGVGAGASASGALVTGAPAPDFAWCEGAELPSASELITALPNGYTSELCSRVEPWIASVSQCLAQGALLLFDYGLPRSHYYHPQRVDGTLRCYFKQRAHNDPFINVGIQDITAWVDFTRVADGALAAGLEVTGFVTQAAFLLGTGIEAMTIEVDDVATRARLAGEARRLLMPGEMGESFKVMALCRDLDAPLRGFAHQDLRGSL